MFFNFLKTKKISWNNVNTKLLVEFVRYLRHPAPPAENVVFIQEENSEPLRKASTVNVIIAAVISFYQYQARLENCAALDIYSFQQSFGNKSYKPFLHHITKGKPSKKSDLKLKIPKLLPKTITPEEFGKLVDACHRIRDRFLLCLMYETGARIGQVLGLRHEDIRTYDNEIIIVPREDNVNFARAKTNESYTIHVTKELMALYTDYLINEFDCIESDYVFVNLWSQPVGRPMSYSAINDLFKRLKKKTGINIRSHLLRHTHATEFLRNGGRIDIAQRRLGHKSIQTTMNIYAHVSNEDMRRAHQNYLEKRNK